MFTIIEPKYHCFYKSLIDQFITYIQDAQATIPTVSEQNSTTFILFQDKEKGVCGGGLLLKKKLNDLPKPLIKSIAPFVASEESIWKCSILLHFENNSSLYTTNEFEIFSQIFYRELYNNLTMLGRKEKTGFLCVSLDSNEYFCIEEIGFWPYVFELKPHDSLDGLFYGILPLIGSQYEAYQMTWKALDFSSEERRFEA